MNRTKFITCIYTELYGSELGGRQGRHHHYRFSLLSLLKMTDADFVCYTSESEIDSLNHFFYEENKISEKQLQIVIYDIWNNKYKDLINGKKNVEETKKSDRCIEIQYSKFAWWELEDGSYDNYYWIDAGLSHCGLIPKKYLEQTTSISTFYNSELFNNTFLENLIKFTDDKFFLIGKENSKYYWSRTVDPKWYNSYDSSVHIIGGLFGGKKENWPLVFSMFEYYMKNILSEDPEIPHEELLLSLINVNHPDLFIKKEFDIWWCPDSGPKEMDLKYYEDKKSFYKILEELNNN